jgi:glycosyltransferase involved in cell wall biosynthesis
VKPSVALVIPSYNCKQYLEKTVTSAKNQTYENLKIYIYDNQSTDGSYELASQLAADSKNIKLIQVDNVYQRSYREAFEHAFENVDFDYVTFLASDDYLSKDYISSYVNVVEKSSYKIKCIQSPICGVRNDTETGLISHQYRSLAEFKQQCLTKSPVTTPSVFYHKSIYEFLIPKSHIENKVQYGGAEDYDMFCNLADNDIFIYPYPKFMGYYYRWHEAQNTWQVHEQKKHFDYDKMIRDFWKVSWS